MPDEIERDDDLAELRAIGRRVGDEPVGWEDPPPDLWDRIAAEAGIDEAGIDATASDPAASDAPSEPFDDRVVAMPDRSPTRWILAAAAAVLVVVGVVGLAVTRGDDAGTPLASSTLDALDLAPAGASGSAELVEVDGRMRLLVDVEGLDEADGFHEVWVIDEAVAQLISLGPLRDDGTYELPAGIDPEAFPIVDVSIEPLDGDPTHSGQSVLRGQLSF